MKKRLIAMIAAGAMVASAGLAVSAYADDTVFYQVVIRFPVLIPAIPF